MLSVIAGVLTYQVGLAAELLFPWLAEREGGHAHAESAPDQEADVRIQPVDVQKPVAVVRTATPLPAQSPTPEAAMRDEPRS